MNDIPTELKHLSSEKQRFFTFVTRHCGFTYEERFKRGTRWVLRFTYPYGHDTNSVYEVRQDDFFPSMQWLRITQTSDEIARPLFNLFLDIYSNYVENER